MACPGVNRKAVAGPDSDITQDTMVWIAAILNRMPTLHGVLLVMLLAKVLPDQALVTWFTPKGPHEVGYHTPLFLFTNGFEIAGTLERITPG